MVTIVAALPSVDASRAKSRKIAVVSIGAACSSTRTERFAVAIDPDSEMSAALPHAFSDSLEAAIARFDRWFLPDQFDRHSAGEAIQVFYQHRRACFDDDSQGPHRMIELGQPVPIAFVGRGSFGGAEWPGERRYRGIEPLLDRIEPAAGRAGDAAPPPERESDVAKLAVCIADEERSVGVVMFAGR